MDHDRGRDFRKKKFNTRQDKEDKQMKRPIILLKSKDSNANKPEENHNVPQTILLKTRDGEKRAVSPQASSAKAGKESEPSPVYHLAPRITAPDLSSLLPSSSEMKSCIKLISPETLAVSDAILDHLTDSTDFLVIGCLGYQGAGKSTILSKLANSEGNETVFPLATRPETGMPGTEGVDVFVTSDRLIFLDTEPLLSCAFLNKRSEDDAENEVEILSLQYAALLLSVCHILILVQDSALDPELMRFLLAAEMLKPSVAPQPDEDPSIDYFPYLIMLHNKADPSLFTRQKVKDLQEAYKYIFSGSQLPLNSGIGIASGTILRSLNPELCGEPLNIFILPHYSVSANINGFNWNIQYYELLKKMRLQLLSLPPRSLTHNLLTEKNWWHYTQKIWEDIKKSTFFPEYGRLLPTQASAKSELGNT